MSSSASVKPGDVLAGKYRVERVLGAGGMGYVVAARHLQLDQLVAMKFLRKGAVDNAEAGARFLREAKAVVKLRNEHIARVFDVGTLESGEPYIVMEHLDGCDLAALAKQRHILPVAEATEYVMQACEALAEAHARGIIHRDIKLANLFVTRGPAGSPLVKVLDFGISKTNPFGESEQDMTRTASMLGSPRFMSPEQMRDPRAVDGRSDIWSLGVVLYRLVSGHPPFEADTLGRLLTMVMHEPYPPLSTARRDLPPGFEQVVARCLEKDPGRRFANVAEFAAALVPYSFDPARARAAADRIAAVQNLPPAPTTGDFSGPLPFQPPSRSHRPSAPSSAGDTGTAAPWSGTNGGGPKPKGMATVWVAVAFAAILIGSVMFAMVRRQNEQKAAAARALADTSGIAAAAPALPAPSPLSPSVDAPGPQPAPEAIATVIGASPITPPAPATGTAMPENVTAPRRNLSPPAPRPNKGSSPRGPTPTAAPAREDGIPTTRD